jgi:hypothetical protein
VVELESSAGGVICRAVGGAAGAAHEGACGLGGWVGLGVRG